MPLSLKAQDIHFSQFFNAPLTVSPSNTGNFDGDWRFTSNYRSQWKRIDTPFLTQSFGFEKQIHLYNERLSGGLLIINDKSAGTLNVMKAMISGAYHKRISIHNFHAGIQAGYITKRISPLEETFPNQFNWNSGQFDPSLPNNEIQLQDKLSYFDLNIGAGYHIKLKKFVPHVNLALFHFNKPKESFFDNGNKLKSRKVINGGVTYEINEIYAIDPGFLLMTTLNANSFLLGSNIIYKLESTAVSVTSIYAGLFYRDGIKRNMDAYFITAGLNYKNYSVGVSYDRNVSSLHTATDYRGAFEISFIYKAINTRLKKVEIPCDRY